MESPASLVRASLRADLFRRAARWIGIMAEIAVFTAMILTTRCANYRDVLVDGKIYFTDADCYSRRAGIFSF
jgi:hypothetical protein